MEQYIKYETVKPGLWNNMTYKKYISNFWFGSFKIYNKVKIIKWWYKHMGL